MLLTGYRSKAACAREPALRQLRQSSPRPATTQGNFVPRPNYHQAKKQKELARKARQLEKQRRRAAARPDGSGEIAPPPQDPPIGPGDPTSSGAT